VSCCCEDLSLSLSQRFSILAQTHLWHAHDHPPAFALRAAQHGLAYECPRLSILVAPSSALCCASQMAWPWVPWTVLVRESTCRNARRTVLYTGTVLATSKFCVKRSTRGKPKYYSHQHTDILDRVELFSVLFGFGVSSQEARSRSHEGNDRRLSPLHIQLGRRRPRTRLARPKWWLGARAAHSRHPGAACRS
jgi:hypothetical protein